ncbi:uncharacterized protein PRCAT00006232001 [Priceomyces carsonii]|uniref:uncharacterized protein n=1 Tax=Priceomyces carsonii TaxID=28549 RepID=UPI002EDB10EC|nr:unnamed protein product [Priceomyces carsonii]
MKADKYIEVIESIHPIESDYESEDDILSIPQRRESIADAKKESAMALDSATEGNRDTPFWLVLIGKSESDEKMESELQTLYWDIIYVVILGLSFVVLLVALHTLILDLRPKDE